MRTTLLVGGLSSSPHIRAEIDSDLRLRALDALLGRDCSASSNNSDTSSDEDLPIKRSFGITTDERAVKRRKVNHAVKEEAEEEEYGLESDCPLFQGLADYVLEVAGASITAARELREGRADIAIAWTGGR